MTDSLSEKPGKPEFSLSDFPLHSCDKIRYADTDRQGHVNNAVFSSFLETGRVEVLYSSEEPVLSEGGSFVIASLTLNFLAEINWPGQIDIGTRVTRIGKSSISLQQGLFQKNHCVATADTVIVQMDEATRRSKPLSDNAIQRLEKLLVSEQ